MAVPLKLQLYDAFLGTQEGIHSIILPDIFSSGGSRNLYIDKFARTRKISGYTKQNSVAVTSDTGSSATRVTGISPYRKTSGGSITRQVLGVFDDDTNEWEVHFSADNGATWTFVEDMGADSVGSRADFAQFGDELFLVNGQINPRVWDGSSLQTAGSTQSPQPTASDAAVAGNLLGTYRYKLVSRFDDGSRGLGSPSSDALTIEDSQASLSWTADSDVDVVGYELYRTTGTGRVFYFVDYIDGRTTVAYTDNNDDLTILENRTMEEHGDAPPICYFCEPHKQRMWWLRTDVAPTRAYWSDPGDADSVYEQNFMDFSDSETIGDVITGALGNFEGRFVVFTERAVWAVSGTGAIIGNLVDWSRTRTNAQIGSVGSRSVVRIPAGSRFFDQNGEVQVTDSASLAYFTPYGDVRLFDGDNDTVISYPVTETLSEFNYAQRTKVHALHDAMRSQIAWFVPVGSDGEPSKAVVWNYRWGVWYVWETLPFSSSAEIETSSDASILLVGESDPSKGGFVYEFFSGSGFDGSPIEAIWMTKSLRGLNEDGQAPLSHRKRWRWVDLLFKITENATLTIEWMGGNAPDDAAALASTKVSPAAAALLTADGDTIQSADGDTLIVSIDSAQFKAFLHSNSGDYLHNEGIRLRVKDNASGGSWSLEAMTLAYQILPGMKRRDQAA